MPPSPEDLFQIEKPDVVATLLFCDIAGYAKAASSMSAAQLVRSLGGQMKILADSLAEHRGTVAKFIGDAVYAYWLEEEHPDHAKLACQFASSLRERLSTAPLKFETRIGINTGRIALVRINHPNHHSLEPYGDAVNLAAQLEAFCGQEKAHALASEQVIAHGGGGPAWTKLESVIVKGRTTPMTLYKLG